MWLQLDGTVNLTFAKLNGKCTAHVLLPQSTLERPLMHPSTHSFIHHWVAANPRTLQTCGQLELGFKPPTLWSAIHSPFYQLSHSCSLGQWIAIGRTENLQGCSSAAGREPACWGRCDQTWTELPHRSASGAAPVADLHMWRTLRTHTVRLLRQQSGQTLTWCPLEIKCGCVVIQGLRPLFAEGSFEGPTL